MRHELFLNLSTGGCECYVAVQSYRLHVLDSEPSLQKHSSSIADQALHGIGDPRLYQCLSGNQISHKSVDSPSILLALVFSTTADQAQHAIEVVRVLMLYLE